MAKKVNVEMQKDKEHLYIMVCHYGKVLNNLKVDFIALFKLLEVAQFDNYIVDDEKLVAHLSFFKESILSWFVPEKHSLYIPGETGMVVSGPIKSKYRKVKDTSLYGYHSETITFTFELDKIKDQLENFMKYLIHNEILIKPPVALPNNIISFWEEF